MIFLIALALALIIGAWLTIGVQHDPGYVMFQYHDWIVESNLAVLMVFFIVVFFTLHYLMQMLVTTRKMPTIFKKFRKGRKVKASQKALDKSTALMLEGKWSAAEWEAIRLIEYSEAPLAHNLVAARAAFYQGERERCQKYLETAAKCKGKQANFSASMTHAELLLEAEDSRQALVILQPMEKKYAKNPKLLHLLKLAYLQEEDWERLLETVQLLAKKETIDPEEKASLEQKAYGYLMRFSAQESSSTAIQLLWQRMPSELKKEEAFIFQYVTYLFDFDEEKEAELVLKQALKQAWFPSLLVFYQRFQSDFSLHLQVLEGWLKLHGAEAQLLRVAGRLALSDKQWDKAHKYLELSLEIEPHTDTYHGLGLAAEQLEQPEKAMHFFKKGLSMNAQPPLALSNKA